MPRYANMIERLRANSKDDANGCWVWQGKTGGGRLMYGYLNIIRNGKHTSVSAHRMSYESNYGPIPDGKEIRHLCHNPVCCNPAHLTLGDRKQNMLDRTLADRKGNKLTPVEVRRIRADQRTQSAIAADYGITQGMVSAIKLRRSWPDVL